MFHRYLLWSKVICAHDLHTSAHPEMDCESVHAAKLGVTFCLVSVSLLAS